MAEDDDNLNDFTLPPHSNEAADAQLDAKALKLVEDYVASLRRSQNENTIRQGVRENIIKLGIHSLAFQHELNAAKMMDKADRASYMGSRRRMGKILADKVEDLFKPEQDALKKRKDKAKEKAAKAAAAAGKETPEQQERRLAADLNPRNDPKSGGAGKAKRGKKMTAVERAEATSAERNGGINIVSQSGVTTEESELVETGDELIARVAREETAKQEQREGADVLDTAISGIKSQSQIAAEKRAEAKL